MSSHERQEASSIELIDGNDEPKNRQFLEALDCLMTDEIIIRCSCGGLQGRVRQVPGDRGNRLVCHCDDCQSFAHFLGKGGEILNRHGGTDIFQLSPEGLEFTTGTYRLACVRLRPKGLMRWYADCCQTPIGNTLATPHVPFVGLAAACIDTEQRTLDEALGPVSARVHGRFAKGAREDLYAHDRAPAALILAFMWKAMRRRIRGAHRLSPFFDPKTGVPVSTPKVLSKSEHEDVRRIRDSADLSSSHI